MRKILLFLIIMSGALSAQGNLIYSSQTWANTFVSDSIDLGLDTELLQSGYDLGTEVRAIALWFDGTWTNTSLTVKACTSLTGSYDAVKEADGTAITITMASNTWVILDPKIFAGLRFIQLSGSAEGGARTLVVVKRIY